MRDALARALATVTDRPVGHWIAELKSPAFRGGWEVQDFYGQRIVWRVETDFGRKTTARRSALLTIADPADALEAMIARSVLPPSFAGDTSRAFWCDRCNGKGVVKSQSHAGVEPCAQCSIQCPRCGGVEWMREHGDFTDPCHADGLVRRGCTDAPRSILDLLAWTSLGADAITRGEQLARESATRLRPWGVRPPVETATTPDGQEVECEKPWRVVWRVADPFVLYANFIPPRGFPDLGLRGHRPAREWQAAYDAAAWPGGNYGGPKNGMTHYRGITAGFCAHWKDARPNPYEPSSQLLALGVVIDAIDGDALVLVCPPLGGDTT